MDEDRYKSAAGWEPPDPYKKLREKARREYESKPQPGQTMLEVRPASQWIIRPSEQKPRAELYGPLWREGDVCVMFGPKGVGKSHFAVQLAEDIATGRDSLTVLSEPGAVATGPRQLLNTSPEDESSKPTVLLIDLEHTTDQFTERYTFPSPIPGKLCRTRFHFKRASFGEFGEIPKCFKGSIHAYLQHSIAEAIYTSRANVVLIDSITYLLRGQTTAATITSVLKTLKLYAQMNNISILATAQTGTPTSMSASARYADELRLSSLADSTFILAPSTYGLEFRYTKLLTTRNQVHQNLAPTSTEVLTYQITTPNSPPYAVGGPTGNTGTSFVPERGVAAALGGRGGSLSPKVADLGGQRGSLNSSFDIRNSSFKYLGSSNESDHTRNYAAEAHEAKLAHERELKKLHHRSSKAFLVDGILNGSFNRYLKGE